MTSGLTNIAVMSRRFPHAVRLVWPNGHLAGEAKAAELDSAALVQQDVRRLEVAVRHACCMQVLQCRRQAACKAVDGTFRQLAVLFQQQHQVAPHAVFQDEPQVVPCLIPMQEGVQHIQCTVFCTRIRLEQESIAAACSTA